MNISIQPLSPSGAPCGEAIFASLSDFLAANDGFSNKEIDNMQAILAMGSGYLIGGGAAGEYRLKKVEEVS
jgi:hypothetical protein